jgi:sulfoxide reductase heme-binding subunit YedZ
MDYKEPYMAIGIIGGWAMVIFGLSYYLRERIGVARWKLIHRFTALAWILGVVHTLGEGTDAGEAWFLAVTAIAVAPVVVLALMRMLTTPASAATQTTAR